MEPASNHRLAIQGGTAIRPEGPPEWPPPDDEVLQALQTVYRDGSWGKYYGNYVQVLEERLARYHDVAYSLTCGSGTFAVELALRALRVGPGDEVLLAAYDYGGNFLCVHAVGALPVLVDVDPDNWNLDITKVAAAIGPATRAVIASHLHGGFVPMRELMQIAAARQVRVIEDAAQAPGAIVQGQKAGTWGDIGVLSFGGSKLLTSGRGGAILTRHADIHQRARLWMNRGNLISPLSELQAAVLLPQLDKLDARNAQRAASVRQLTESLVGIPGLRPFTNRDNESQPGYYKVGWQFDQDRFGMPREQFLAAIRPEGMAFDKGFAALQVGRSPSRYRAAGNLVHADRAHRDTVVLHHPVLLGPDTGVQEVALAVKKVYANVHCLGG